MVPIKGENLRPMKSYKKQNKSQIFYCLIVHLLIAIACSLLCSYSYWFPSLYTVKHLLFMSLPNSWYGVFNPRCLFIVANFIIVFLIGESRLGSRQSSPANEMYNEYVERTRSLRGPPSTFQEKKEERTLLALAILSQKEDNVKILEEKEVDETKEDSHEDDQDEDFKECEGTDEEENEKKEEEKEDEKKDEVREEEQQEEAAGIPAEELNKRVEDFIARVNKQRWLEARFLVCSKA